MLSKRRNSFRKLEAAAGRFAFLPANAWTTLAIILALLTAYFLSTRNFSLAVLFFAITAFLDFVDGAVARYRKTANARGAYFDTVADRYVEFFLIFGLIIAGLPAYVLPSEIWLLLYLFGAMMTTYAKAAAKEKSMVKDEMRGGLLERAERLSLLFLGILLAVVNVVWLTYVIVLLAILSNITALQRIGMAMKLKPR